MNLPVSAVFSLHLQKTNPRQSLGEGNSFTVEGLNTQWSAQAWIRIESSYGC